MTWTMSNHHLTSLLHQLWEDLVRTRECNTFMETLARLDVLTFRIQQIYTHLDLDLPETTNDLDEYYTTDSSSDYRPHHILGSSDEGGSSSEGDSDA